MSNKSMDELLETYVPSCMDKVLDHYEKQSKKMAPPSEEYKNNMKKLIRREKIKRLYHIPIRTTRRIAAVLVISLLAGMMASMSVEAVREKLYDWVKDIYDDITLYRYDVKEESGHFVPVYPSYIPKGYKLKDTTKDEYTLILTYTDKTNKKNITITEFWIIDGDKIYENNEFIKEKTITIQTKKANLGYTEDGIMIRWDAFGCRMGIDSNLENEDELIKIGESLKAKGK